ncbi:MAG TPA: hypothetical protein VER96_08305 [Polyangiaceae bacterium]|nr:hypothetical protein [Polyangiaceae bacterium]
MNLRKLSHVAVLLAVACEGKLTVDRGGAAAGSGGSAGTSGLAENAGSPEDPASTGADGGRDALGESDGIGGSGGSGGFVIPPDAGKLGRPCLPGGIVTESEGIAADIETLTRCDSGLACNTEGECVTPPDCQTSDGVCVVRSPVLDGTGYNVIVALAADDSHVYWLENWRHGGTMGPFAGVLSSYSIADRRIMTMATVQADPSQLALTTTHAYLSTMSSESDNGNTQLLRLPLSGGNTELVQQWDYYGIEPSFVAVGSQAFWSDGGTVYSMTSDPEAIPTPLNSVDSEAPPMVLAASDGVDLFYWLFADTSTPLMRTPLANFAPGAVGIEYPLGRGFALHGDGFFALTRAVPRVDLTPGRGIMLSRVPKNGGEYEAVRSLGDGSPRSLQILGDRYFFASDANSQTIDSFGHTTFDVRVSMGSLNDDAPPIRLIEHTMQSFDDVRFVATAHDLFWTDGKTLYQQPLPAR